jgi:hypothetical protein
MSSAIDKIPYIVMATAAGISRSVHVSWDTLASLATQSLIGMLGGIYIDMSKELKEGLVEIVKRHVLADDVDAALKELQSFIDLDKFAVLLAWLELRYSVYGLKGFSIIREVETGDILTVGVYLKSCSKDEWSEIARNVKSYLNSHGLADVTGKVSIICLKGLEELGIEIKPD